MNIKNFPFIVAISLFIGFFSSANAQYNVTAKIINKLSNEPVEFAAARLLQKTDSALVAGVTTDSTGVAHFKAVKTGNYILQVSYVGYHTGTKDFQVESKNIDLGEFLLEEDSKLLKDLEVTGTAVQVIVKGDTIEYNAGAFKTAENAVVEELLKKMPGVEITSDGKILVNGEEVKKIRVDGKKFFGDDKEMATKNIPAHLIEKVQVIDQKSEMAQLTGFDDGESERIINLTIRKDRRQGIFGNATAGVGADINPEFRYDTNLFLNIMNGDTRSTVTAGGNNVNTARSGRGRGGFGGGGNGITETQNFGYNINSEINKKLLIGGDVTFNHSDNMVESNSNRENYMQGSTYYTINSRNNNRENYQGNVRLEVEWKPDSNNTFILQPNFGMTRSFTNNSSEYEYAQEEEKTSWGTSRNSGEGQGQNGGFTLIYNRKLAKRGRTFTTRLNTNFSDSYNDGFNFSEKITPDSTVILDQRNENSSENYSFGANLSFVEPIGTSMKHFLETTASFNGNVRNSVRNLFDQDHSGEYSVKNMEYSNAFENRFFRETMALNYRYVHPDFNMMFGLNAEPSQTFSSTIYGDQTPIALQNKVFNFAPSSNIRYNFGRRTFARLIYRGRTNQPSISQMQPVKNNTDLMNETVGNMGLKPAFTHDLRLMYSNYNTESFRSYSIGLNGSATQNNLTNNSIYDNSGKRYVQTINSEKTPYNLNLFLMYNQPFLKKFNVSNNASFGMNQHYGYTSKNVSNDDIDIDNLVVGDLSSTVRYNASENLSVSFTHEIIDLAVRGGVRYSYSLNNFNNSPTETMDWIGTFNMGVRPTKFLTFTTDLNYSEQSGYTGFNARQWIWNASMDVSVFDRKGTFSLRAVDILQQRQNISQRVGDNFIEFSKSNSLPSYFILSFTYRISKFAGITQKEMEESAAPGGRGRRGGGGGPGGGRGGGGAVMPYNMF